MLERIDSRELTEWLQLFRLKNEEFERAREGEVIEEGQRPDAWDPIDDDDEDDTDEEGEIETDG